MLAADAPRREQAVVSGKSVLVRVMLVLALLGLGDATYLTVVHFAGITVLCAAHGTSPASRWRCWG
jgi:hypothetical protein